MKKILLLLLLVSGIAFQSCRDEALNPVPEWEYGLHAYTIFDGIPFDGKPLNRPQAYEKNNAINFSADKQDAATAGIPLKIRWVSLDNKLTAAKIDVYVRMFESYDDPDKNPRVADLSGGVPKLLTSITAPAGNRQWNTFKVTPAQIYNLFKDAKVKYDKVNEVKVFENPGFPRPTGQWFDGKRDSFQITWKVTSTDGLVYENWGANLCGDPTAVSEANSNCSLSWTVNGCESVPSQFTGTWAVVEDGWQDYKVGDAINVKAGPGVDEITVGVFATDIDHKDIVVKINNKFTGAATVAKQTYGTYTAYLSDGAYSAVGDGSVNGCSGSISLTLEHAGVNSGVIGKYKLVLKRK